MQCDTTVLSHTHVLKRKQKKLTDEHRALGSLLYSGPLILY